VQAFSAASTRDFAWYFNGESSVPVTSLQDMHTWLSACRYVHDHVQFCAPDYWQHPQKFEHLRAGDCEDYALWAWRKLVELQYDAEFMVGYVAIGESGFGRHAWIVYQHDGVRYLYEPTRTTLDDAVRRFADVHAEYVPEFGVGRDLQRFTYHGRLLTALRSPTEANSVISLGPAMRRSTRRRALHLRR
jgi:hypothetical protein